MIAGLSNPKLRQIVEEDLLAVKLRNTKIEYHYTKIDRHDTKIEYHNTKIGNTQGDQDWTYDR